MIWITIITKGIVVAAYIYVIQKLFKFKFTIKKYVRFTKTTHTGFSFRLFALRCSIHYVKAEEEGAVIDKDVGLSRYKRKGRRGMGFSFHDKNLLFLIKKATSY